VLYLSVSVGIDENLSVHCSGSSSSARASIYARVYCAVVDSEIVLYDCTTPHWCIVLLLVQLAAISIRTLSSLFCWLVAR
jgi:hypothetical protein